MNGLLAEVTSQAKGKPIRSVALLSGLIENKKQQGEQGEGHQRLQQSEEQGGCFGIWPFEALGCLVLLLI